MSAAISSDSPAPASAVTFAVEDYDLPATLSSGQAFRWRREGDAWIGVVSGRWVELRHGPGWIAAKTATPVPDWNWLRHYLQVDLNLESVLKTFPEDAPMQAAVQACRGLRLLRQDPWECLASFILSSTKQIVQIQQIVGLLCDRFGDPIPALPEGTARAFPRAETIASLTEQDLRDCRMGFRAPYLLETARRITSGAVDLEGLKELPLESARERLTELPGVGRKIADCVLLFAFGFATAFPVDVWVIKALRHLYFPRRRPKLRQLQRFSETHFGPNAGYAQQYLFHYMRTVAKRI